MRTLAPVPIVHGRAQAPRLIVTLAVALLGAGPSSAVTPPKAKPAPAQPKESLSGFYRKGSPGEREAKPAAASRPGLFSRRTGAARAPARPAVTPAYRDAVKRWHEACAMPAPRGPQGQACLALANLNAHERAVLCPHEQGGFAADELEAAASLFREPESENAHPVHPRLLALLLAIQEHFHAGEVRLLSGYRSPWEGNSNHGKGRAADLVIPGASDDAVAGFARGLGFVGVGIYPTSHFVHVDVRDASYFWVDASAPGRPHRERAILASLAKESDERAKARGDLRVFGPVVKHDARTWIAARTTFAEASVATELEASAPEENRRNGGEPSSVKSDEDADLDAADEPKRRD